MPESTSCVRVTIRDPNLRIVALWANVRPPSLKKEVSDWCTSSDTRYGLWRWQQKYSGSPHEEFGWETCGIVLNHPEWAQTTFLIDFRALHPPDLDFQNLRLSNFPCFSDRVAILFDFSPGLTRKSFKSSVPTCPADTQKKWGVDLARVQDWRNAQPTLWKSMIFWKIDYLQTRFWGTSSSVNPQKTFFSETSGNSPQKLFF